MTNDSPCSPEIERIARQLCCEEDLDPDALVFVIDKGERRRALVWTLFIAAALGLVLFYTSPPTKALH